MVMPDFNKRFLDDADPESPETLMLRLQQGLEEIKKRVLQLENLGQATALVGDVDVGNGSFTAGGARLSADGAALDGPDAMAVNFWASIGVPSNIVTDIYALAVIGTKLYVGGYFTRIGTVNANYIAVYDTVTGVWSALGTGLNAQCNDLAVIGSDLYVVGTFTLAGGVANTARIAKWNGTTWSALGTGLNASVQTIEVVGTDIYVGGYFSLAGGGAAARIAKWNGATWSALGTGLDDACRAIVAIGSDIYAGGDFLLAGGVANTVHLAKWNGSAWSALGTGLNDSCYALAVIDVNLYIGGAFTDAGGVTGASKICGWDGTAYFALASGLNDVCRTLAVFGSDLYLGGQFTLVDGLAMAYIAKWSNGAFVEMGSGLNGNCYALALIGSDVYVGGTFTQAGGRASLAVAAYLVTLQSVLAYLEITEQALQDAIIQNGTLYDTTMAHHGLARSDGWVLDQDTWTQVSASSFSKAGDWTTLFRKGTYLKFTQTTVKYAAVASSSYSAGVTTVNIIVNTDYTLANAAISETYYSYQVNPVGWPVWFNRSGTGIVTGTGGTNTGYTQTVNTLKYRVFGNSILEIADIQITNKGSWSGTLLVAPAVVTANADSGNVGVGGGIWADGALAPKGYICVATTTSFRFAKTAGTGARVQWSDVAVNDWLAWRLEYQY